MDKSYHCHVTHHNFSVPKINCDNIVSFTPTMNKSEEKLEEDCQDQSRNRPCHLYCLSVGSYNCYHLKDNQCVSKHSCIVFFSLTQLMHFAKFIRKPTASIVGVHHFYLLCLLSSTNISVQLLSSSGRQIIPFLYFCRSVSTQSQLFSKQELSIDGSTHSNSTLLPKVQLQLFLEMRPTIQVFICRASVYLQLDLQLDILISYVRLCLLVYHHAKVVHNYYSYL